MEKSLLCRHKKYRSSNCRLTSLKEQKSSSAGDPKKTARKEMDAGDNAIFIACDASKQSDVEGLIDGTVNYFGKIDIAVLNAGGILNAAPVAEMTDESWEYTLNLNLNHTFWGMALQHMLPQEDGRIIAISSVEGKMRTETVSHYVATNMRSRPCKNKPTRLGQLG